MYDVVIIGAGIAGASIAHYLAQFQLNLLLLEKEDEISAGTTKANSAIIHAGYDCIPGTLKAKLNVRGNDLYEQIAKKLNFPYRKIGSLVVAYSPEEVAAIEELYQRGIQNQVPDLRILSPEEVIKIEPTLQKNVLAALYAPSAAIIGPYEATIAMIEHAVLNGLELALQTPVVEIKKQDNSFLINQNIETRYIINAAGVHADQIAALVQDNFYQIIPRKGEYILLDKQYIAHHVLFQAPSVMGKGVLITPTVHGDVIIGPTAEDVDSKEDTRFTADGLNKILAIAPKTMEHIPFSTVITSFAGIRAIASDDFIIEESNQVKHFIHVAGISSPGLASAPAIAEYVSEILEKSGLKLIAKEDYRDTLPAFIKTREMKLEDYHQLILKQPLYGKIVCRCEQVSEQEIIDAITGLVPALTMDALKRKIRTGMGRCQGGFCTIRVMELLHSYAKIPYQEIMKSGLGSYLILQKTKGDDHE